MNKAALLKKIRTLAERGVGGEAENAEKLLAHMMEKYDISEDELDADIRERNDFEYHGKEQKKILRQVVYKVTGGNAYELYYGAPSEYPSADMSKPYTGAKTVNDALADCLELTEVMREIQVTRDKVEEIDAVLAQMEEGDAHILRLWYIERKSKDKIAEAVCYASPTSIYDQRNKALVRFALLYFGAGAMPSM